MPLNPVLRVREAGGGVELPGCCRGQCRRGDVIPVAGEAVQRSARVPSSAVEVANLGFEPGPLYENPPMVHRRQAVTVD